MSKSKVYTSKQQKDSKKTKSLGDLDQSNLNLGFSNSGGSTLSSARTTSAVVLNGSSNFSPTPFPGPQMPIANGNGNGDGCVLPPPPPPLPCDDTMDNGGGDNSGMLTPPPVPTTPIPTSTPQVTLVGDESITEGSRGSFRLQLDRVSQTDLTFTIRINDGSAVCFDGDGSGQKTKGDLRKGVIPGLDRDFTVYDSQGQIISGDTITLTVRAGQTTSEQINVQTWQEQVSMGGKKVMTPDTPAGEGNENFSLEIVDACGCQVAQPQMPVTIIDDTPYKWHSPLTIDLNGDGVKTLSIDRGVQFDLLNTGSKANVGWVSAKDGLLAVDSNGNGKIDNGKELFGGGVGEGFAKLDSFDTNRDGIVNAKDQGFDSLKIWQDRNSNGVTDRGELQSLSVFGIKSLNVDHIAYDQAAELDKQGNILGERGSVTTTSGKSLDMIDVYFQVGAALPVNETAIG
jgi:hypothetical protein